MAAKNASGDEMKVGDEIALTGIVVQVHAELVTIRLDTPEGTYSPSLTFHPGKVKKSKTK